MSAHHCGKTLKYLLTWGILLKQWEPLERVFFFFFYFLFTIWSDLPYFFLLCVFISSRHLLGSVKRCSGVLGVGGNKPPLIKEQCASICTKQHNGILRSLLHNKINHAGGKLKQKHRTWDIVCIFGVIMIWHYFTCKVKWSLTRFPALSSVSS